jgi:hypothetical protein
MPAQTDQQYRYSPPVKVAVERDEIVLSGMLPANRRIHQSTFNMIATTLCFRHQVRHIILRLRQDDPMPLTYAQYFGIV